MLTCITCSKQREEEDAPAHTKDAVKSLTNQIKDMALKVSGTNKPKPNSETDFKKGQRSYSGFDSVSRNVPYTYVSSSSNPAWDFPSIGNLGSRPDSRLGLPESVSNSSTQQRDLVLEHEAEAKDWMAQVEPGVQITFASLPSGGNDLKRIRFSREMFNKWEAQRWWGENYDRIMELYNVQRFNQQALNSTPGRSEDGRESTYSRLASSPRMTPSINREWAPRYKPSEFSKGETEIPSVEAPRTTCSSRDEAAVSVSNASEIESEWIEEDEPGVYITIRQLADGTRELRRVRFSREKFGEVHAKLWWETNRDRIQSQYLL